MTITKTLVPNHLRMQKATALFGIGFSLKVEPVIYTITDKLAPEYQGGYWEFYVLSNDGFYMAPVADRYYRVSSENGFEGVLSADALGVTVCLYAYSHLSFADDSMAEVYANQYHFLRNYLFEHLEVEDILKAID